MGFLDQINPFSGDNAVGNWVRGMFADPTKGYRDQLSAYAQMAGGRTAPQLGTAPQAQYSAYRPMQQDLAQQLQAQARGEGPSLATQMLNQGADRAARGAASTAASATGPNAALAQYQAQQVGGQLSDQANQQAAAARIQEQYNAQNQLGLLLHGGREADEGMNRFNVGVRNERDQANLEALLRQMGLNDAAVINALTGAGGIAGVPSQGERLLGGAANFLALRGASGGGAAAGPTQVGGGRPPGWY